MRHKRIGRSSGYVSQTDHLDQKAKKLRCPIAMRQIRLPRMLIIGNLRLIALACSAMRRIRPRVMTHVAGPITALAVFCAAAPAASAQQAPDLAAPPPLVSPSPPNSFLSGLQVIAYPYFWMAGLNMAITTPLARAPKVNISAGPGEIISDLNNVPFMGAAELRDGPLGFLPDAMHIPLGSRSPRETSFFGRQHWGGPKLRDRRFPLPRPRPATSDDGRRPRFSLLGRVDRHDFERQRVYPDCDYLYLGSSLFSILIYYLYLFRLSPIR